MSAEREAADFIEHHVTKVRPLYHRSALAGWEAATTGSEEALRLSAEARSAAKQLYSSADDYAEVKRLRTTGDVRDPLLDRQLELLEQAFTVSQLSSEVIEDLTFREAELEGIYYNFRAEFEGGTPSNNDLREMLVPEDDSDRRRRIWEASKTIGEVVAEPLRELVRRRNAAARSLGFRNYYEMSLWEQEIRPEELADLLQEFRRLSEGAYADVRTRLDARMAERFGIAIEDLRPWHWDDFFSQEAPAYGEVDLDPYFAPPLDQESLARDYFSGIGLPIDDVLARSDLYERKGKDQHAFCTDIDREGDVRILCNLRPDERWAKTLLHELGHAVYDKYLPRSLPFLLRTPAHTLSTEAIAMYFGRLTRDAEWLRDTLGVALADEAKADLHKQQRLSMLIAARWMLVMTSFESALYEDPDRPDLNSLWWDLVEENQLIRRPEGRDAPDWATKIHLALAPVYYHNYLLGELMASQLAAALEAAGSRHAPGEFLRSQIFDRGATLTWNELLRQATGGPLSARFFVEQFVGEPLAGSS